MPRHPCKQKSSPERRRAAAQSSEPYPDHHHPTQKHCRAVRDALLALHGLPDELARYRRSDTDETPSVLGDTVLDGVISFLLSQNTTDSNSRRAFRSLKSTFPTWEQVLFADPKNIEDAIRCGGMAVTKAARIKSIVGALMEKRGEICLEYLRGMSISEVKAELSQFKGIGPKTVACVLMFHLRLDDFPVDTHVFRISKAIGWIPTKADRAKAYLHLNKRIPDELKFDLNCLLTSHGKLCKNCGKKRSSEELSDDGSSSAIQCPLTDLL